MAFWNKKIINLEDKYFGLDLGESSVKVFQLEKDGNLDRIRSFNVREISPGLIENELILEPEKLSKIIREAISSAGPKKINTKKVICSIPESKVFLRTISIPIIKEEEAAEAVKWEIEAGIPLEVDRVYFDWQFLEQKDGKQNVLTVAVSKEVVDNLVALLESCGLSVYGMEMESISTARSLIARNVEKEAAYLIVDIGTLKTSFIIIQNGVPCFTSSIPFSSHGITDLIASQMGISREEAEKIKIFQGIEHSSAGEANPVLAMLKSLLENLSTEIERTIDFYHTLPDSETELKKVIISGGSANLKGLVPYLATKLSYEVVLGNPWTNLNLGKNLPIISRADSVRYATVIGLAMREIDYGNKT